MAFDINLGFGPDDTWYGDYLKLKSKVDNGKLVEVVRCSDCINSKLHEPKEYFECNVWNRNVGGYEFCHMGERRDEQ